MLSGAPSRTKRVLCKQKTVTFYTNLQKSGGTGPLCPPAPMSMSRTMHVITRILLSPVTAIEVNRTILNLDQTKFIVPYSIPIKALKILGPKISQPLTKIINLSFTKGIFPSKLKIAKVISIFKKVIQKYPQTIDQFLFYLYLAKSSRS